MITTALTQYLKNSLPSHFVPWVIAALHQDGLIWQSLSASTLSDKLCSQSGSHDDTSIEYWRPARLALLELGQSYHPPAPMEPVDARLLRQVNTSYPNLILNPSELDLSRAGAIAIALADWYRRSGSWDFLRDEIDGHPDFPWQTPLACLFGLVLDPIEMLKELASRIPSPLHSRLAIHAVLSNPADAQTQVSLLHTLTHCPTSCFPARPLDHLDFLQALNAQNPTIAGLYCQEVLAKQVPCSPAPLSHPFHMTHIMQESEHTLLQVELTRLAGDSPAHNQSLEKLLVMRHLASATILVDVTTQQAQQPNDTLASADLIAAWKQAISMTQSVQPAALVDPYKAGLANALAQAGKAAESQAWLPKDEASLPRDAYQLLAIVRSASQVGDQVLAQQAGALLADVILQADQAPGYCPPSIAVSPMQAAEALIHVGLPEAAIRVLEAAVQQAPNHTAAHRMLADLQLSGDLLPEASRTLQTLSALHPEDLGLRRDLARIYESTLNWGAALDEWTALIEDSVYPDQSEEITDLHSLALCALNSEQPAQALHACQRALNLSPEDGLACTYIGQAYVLMNDEVRGLEYLTQATQTSPELPEAWLGLTGLLTRQKHIDQAIDTLKTAIQILPNHAPILAALGDLHLQENKPTLAVDILRQAVNLDAKNAGYRYSLGLALNQLGHTVEARHELEAAYLARPTDLSISNTYGTVLLALGDFSAAITPLEAGIRSRAFNQPAPYLDYARAVLELYRQKDTSVSPVSALEAVEHAISIDPDLPDSRAMYAEALSATGNLPAAFKAYQDALDTSLTEDRRWRERLSCGLGQVALQLGRNDIAIAALQEAIAAAPHTADNYKLLSDAYLSSNLLEDSLRAARTVLNLNVDDLVNLSWYAEQVTRLVSQTSTVSSPAFQNQARQAVLEAQNALLQAAQLAPQRVDLLIRLGKLQQMAGETGTAISTLNQIATNDKATVDQLRDAAIALHALNDIPGEILCLQNAIAQDEAHAKASLPQLLALLAGALTQKGDLRLACDTYEKAISISPEHSSLYYDRTNLLLKMAREEDAFCCVETGISLARTDPMLPRLYFLAAALYRQKGDLASALGYTQKGLEIEAKLPSSQVVPGSGLLLSDRLFIADLYRACLQPLMAYQILKSEPAATSPTSPVPPDEYLAWVTLKTELELELGYVPAFDFSSKDPIDSISPTTQWLSLQARMAYRNGWPELADKFFQSAIRSEQARPADTADGSNPASAYPHRTTISLIEAALDLGSWSQARPVIQRLLELSSHEPYAHLANARLIILAAEFQGLCARFDVQRHSPGVAAISEAEEQILTRSIQEVFHLIQELEKNSETYDLAYGATLLERWQARGQIAFSSRPPDPADTAVLQAALARLKLSPSNLPLTGAETAAVLTGMCLLGEWDPDETVLAQVLQLTRSHSRDGLVWFHAALALEADYPQEAVSAARGVIQMLASGKYSLAALNQALLARLAFHQKDLPQAGEAIEAALSIWPDEPHWHFLAAEICKLADRLSDQIKHLEEAAQLEPKSLPNQLELGKAYLSQSAQDPASLDRAIHALDTAVHLAPSEPFAWLWLARAQFQARQISAASASVSQALALDPANTDAAILQAEIALNQNEFQQAHDLAQSVAQANPQDTRTTLLLAKTLKSLNRPAEALQMLESVLPTSENPLQIQYERVDLLHQLNGPEVALKVLTNLVDEYPDDANILASLARSQASLGDNQTAIQTALSALQAARNSLPARDLAKMHFMTGTLMRQAGQLDQAIHHLSEAVAQAPDMLDAYLELGIARKERREFQQALNAFEQATQIAPRDPRPHYMAGLALKEGKDYKRSERMLRQAAHLAPDDVVIRRQLAQVVALNVVHNSSA